MNANSSRSGTARPFTFPAAGACLAAAVLLAGCGASADPAAPSPVATPTPAGTSELRLPLAAYMPSDTQQAQQRSLETILTRICMRDLGFAPRSTVSLSDAIDLQVRTDRHLHSRRYGISDRRVAAEWGYRMPPFTSGSTPPISLDDLPEDELAAWQGPAPGMSAVSLRGKPIPKDGCRGEASRTVGRVQATTRGLAAKLSQKSLLQLKGDQRIIRLHARWAQCMAAKGYKYSSPWTSGTDFTGDEEADPSSGPVKAEVKAAVADVDCTYETNVLGISFAVESEYQNLEIEKNAEELEKEREQVERQAESLQNLVTKYGGQG